MEISKTKEITVNISLSEEEAKWLKAIMQNPFHSEEDNRDRRMRKTFWEVLNAMGIDD